MWDAATGQETLTLKGHTDQVFGLAFSPDGKRLASASQDNTVKLWDLASGQEVLTLKGPRGYVGQSLAFSPNGKRLSSAGGRESPNTGFLATGGQTKTRFEKGQEKLIIWDASMSMKDGGPK